MDTDYTEGTQDGGYTSTEVYRYTPPGEIRRAAPIVRGGTGCMSGVVFLLPLALGAVLTVIIFIASILAEPRLWIAYLGLGGLWLWRSRLAITGYPRGRNKRR